MTWLIRLRIAVRFSDCDPLGHVNNATYSTYLEQARALGDILIVGVNTDGSVRRNKGPERPINPERERAELLAALTCVEAVVLFDEDTPAEIIRAVQPDILVKGADWAHDAIVGLRPEEQSEREGLNITEHGERAYNT